jgi:hypothetical protein
LYVGRRKFAWPTRAGGSLLQHCHKPDPSLAGLGLTPKDARGSLRTRANLESRHSGRASTASRGSGAPYSEAPVIAAPKRTVRWATAPARKAGERAGHSGRLAEPPLRLHDAGIAPSKLAQDTQSEPVAALPAVMLVLRQFASASIAASNWDDLPHAKRGSLHSCRVDGGSSRTSFSAHGLGYLLTALRCEGLIPDEADLQLATFPALASPVSATEGRDCANSHRL